MCSDNCTAPVPLSLPAMPVGTQDSQASRHEHKGTHLVQGFQKVGRAQLMPEAPVVAGHLHTHLLLLCTELALLQRFIRGRISAAVLGQLWSCHAVK